MSELALVPWVLLVALRTELAAHAHLKIVFVDLVDLIFIFAGLVAPNCKPYTAAAFAFSTMRRPRWWGTFSFAAGWPCWSLMPGRTATPFRSGVNEDLSRVFPAAASAKRGGLRIVTCGDIGGTSSSISDSAHGGGASASAAAGSPQREARARATAPFSTPVRSPPVLSRSSSGLFEIGLCRHTSSAVGAPGEPASSQQLSAPGEPSAGTRHCGAVGGNEHV